MCVCIKIEALLVQVFLIYATGMFERKLQMEKQHKLDINFSVRVVEMTLRSAEKDITVFLPLLKLIILCSIFYFHFVGSVFVWLVNV
jgi:hypothetical protein